MTKKSRKSSASAKNEVATTTTIAAPIATNAPSKSNTHYHHYGGSSAHTENMIWIDPIYIRFQHARIRSKFSSCGRTLTETLNSIRNHEITPLDLPPIQVLIGPQLEDDSGHRWYFSLNNRRLWVLKRCREEGLLEPYSNMIQVRVREPKSQNETDRYTVQNCSIDAKILRDRGSKIRKKDGTSSNYSPNSKDGRVIGYECSSRLESCVNDNDDDVEDDDGQIESSDESSDDCSSTIAFNASKNRFGALC